MQRPIVSLWRSRKTGVVWYWTVRDAVSILPDMDPVLHTSDLNTWT